MRRNETGFTLIELLVVVLIVGILAAFSIPQYTKAVESAKADDAAGILKAIGTANRMFRLDNGQYVSSGKLDDACNTKCCYDGPSGSCGESQNDVCQLIACNYLGSQPWDSLSYEYRAGTNPSCGGGISGEIACAKRCSGTSPCTTATPYSTWGYGMSSVGKVTAYPSSGGPPEPPS